jgi:hypothetical protein
MPVSILFIALAFWLGLSNLTAVAHVPRPAVARS